MMRPPRGFCRFIRRKASCVHRKVPVRFVSTTACHCSHGQLLERHGGRADAGVVEEQVEPLVALIDLREHRPHRLRVGDVARDRDGAVPRLGGGLLERLAATAGEDDGPARPREGDRDRPPDPAACAGDERDPLHGPDSTSGRHDSRRPTCGR